MELVNVRKLQCRGRALLKKPGVGPRGGEEEGRHTDAQDAVAAPDSEPSNTFEVTVKVKYRTVVSNTRNERAVHY